MANNIEQKVEILLKPKIKELGYELYDVQYVKEGKDYFLRVFIDNKSGIDLNDCEKISNEINPLLDENDFIKDAYFLEVSSPGIERVLRKDEHLKDAIGEEVEVNLFKPLENNKEFVGILKDFDDEKIILECEKNVEIDRKNIALIKIKFNW